MFNNAVTFSVVFNHFREVKELWKVIFLIVRSHVSNGTSNHTHVSQPIELGRGFTQVEIS